MIEGRGLLRRKFGNCASSKVNAGLSRFRFQRGDQESVLDHVSERLAFLDFAAEGEKHRPHRVVEPAVGHHHVEDRLRLVGDGLPNAERREQPPRGCNDRGCALVVGMAFAEHRIGDGYGERGPEPLAQRDRKREAGEAAACNQHVNLTIPASWNTHPCTGTPVPGSIAWAKKRANP